MKDEPKSLIEHIIELRSVILKSFVYIAIGMCISFAFVDELFTFLIRLVPSENNIIYTTVMEPLTTEFRISFYSALIVAIPLIMFEVWKFIKPGLLGIEQVAIKRTMIYSYVLFTIGNIFAYYVVLPNVYDFLSSMQIFKGQNIDFFPRMGDNISFILMVMLSFGVCFQLPLVMILLDRFGIFSISRQREIWREYIVCIVIVSAIITPPDVLSMVFLSLPLILLYCGTLLVMSVDKKN